MRTTRIHAIKTLDFVASTAIGFGLGYLVLHRLELAALVAVGLCGLGALAKLLAFSMAAKVQGTGHLDSQ